ncbi:hydrolase [Teredinibacter turnerae]|uniref:hydrolase n=1 Tax=Teredinibacter turnerae TaxID=2426 RepID=UPI00037A2B85|nr:hydrolase [Teredinibacter turnerae]
MLEPKQQLKAFLTDKTEPMLELIIAAANINSGSENASGIAKVATLFQREFSSLTAVSRSLPLRSESPANDCAEIFEINPNATRRVLMLGHLDTVFPSDHHFNTCWRQGDRLRGPGVADMKGGIVVMLMALKALLKCELLPNLGVTVVLTPDEEIGSPRSRDLLRSMAQIHDCGLVFEPALEDGTLAGARKGSGNFQISVKGRSAHAGREFFKGINAVTGAASLAGALASLSDVQSNTSVNIAKITGGSAINVVPDTATIHFNVRVEDHQRMTDMERAIRALLEQFNSQGPCSFTLEGDFHRPPKVIDGAHQKLFSLLEACGDALNQTVKFRATGGCCDGNNLAAAGLPNIDTLGVLGGGIHSENEFLLIDSLVERTLLTAFFITQLPSVMEKP